MSVASLLHDDVLDDSDTRRGIASLNFVMGNKLAVLAGDFLFARACISLASLKNTEVVSLMATAMEHLVTGEKMQMTSTSEQRCSMEYYLQKTYNKTASLVSNSCKAIAVLAGQSSEVSMLAYEYGRNLGLLGFSIESGIGGISLLFFQTHKESIGVVQGWAAIVMGVLSGSIPWFTMNVIHRHWPLLQAIDDTLGVFHTHAVAGVLGGISTGLFAEEVLCNLFLPVTNSHGAVYGGGVGGSQLGKQIAGALFIIGWNVVVTSIICLVIKLVIPLRIPDDQLLIGDDAVHGEEAYALWGDGDKLDTTRSGTDNTEHSAFAVGVTQNV